MGQNLHVDFTPTDTVNYTNAAANVTINVLKATPTVNWTNPGGYHLRHGAKCHATERYIYVGGEWFTGYSWRDSDLHTCFMGRVPNAGTGQNLHVTFTPSDTTNYNNATGDVMINIVEGECDGGGRPIDVPEHGLRRQCRTRRPRDRSPV